MNAEIAKLYDDKVFDVINNFIKSRGYSSDKTKEAYESRIREFFMIVKGKEIEYLQDYDLKITLNDLEYYRAKLKEKNGNNSINSKVSTISKLYNVLKANEFDVNVDIFKVIDSLPVKSNSYGKLTLEQGEQMAKYALEEQRDAKEKYLLIILAIRTLFRKSELLNLTWDDFNDHGDWVEVRADTKGNGERSTGITKELYNQLLKLKATNKEKVFKLTENQIRGMMDRIKEKMGFTKKDNITFHSFRNIGVNFELDETGDVRRAASNAGHKSMNTTYKYYMDKKKDLSNSVGIRMEQKFDTTFIDEIEDIELFKQFLKQSNRKEQMEFKKFIKNKLSK